MTYFGAPGVIKVAARKCTFEDIEEIICSHFSISPKKIYGTSRRAELVMIRHLIAYFALEFMNISTKEVGRRMNRDHSTIVKSRIAVNNLIFSDPGFKKEIEDLRNMIRESNFFD